MATLVQTQTCRRRYFTTMHVACTKVIRREQEVPSVAEATFWDALAFFVSGSLAALVLGFTLPCLHGEAGTPPIAQQLSFETEMPLYFVWIPTPIGGGGGSSAFDFATSVTPFV